MTSRCMTAFMQINTQPKGIAVMIGPLACYHCYYIYHIMSFMQGVGWSSAKTSRSQADDPV